VMVLEGDHDQATVPTEQRTILVVDLALGPHYELIICGAVHVRRSNFDVIESSVSPENKQRKNTNKQTLQHANRQSTTSTITIRVYRNTLQPKQQIGNLTYDTRRIKTNNITRHNKTT
jgi:hypothetical protein